MLKFINGVIYFFNWIAAFSLFFSFAIPYLPPSKFPILSVVSLGVPLLIIVNLIFFLYWILKLNRRLFLSALALVSTFLYFNVFYEFSSEGDTSKYENTLSVLSYNVRMFNEYEEKFYGDVPSMMAEIIKEEDPDIICFQEYFRFNKLEFPGYSYNYQHYRRKKDKWGYAIYSKYPLINTGGFDFPDSGNNTIYADVVKGKDTIRLYNMHLQSHGIIPEVQFLQETDKENLLRHLSRRFKQQEEQIKIILEHKGQTHLPVIMAGDLNNTAFSYNYRKLKEGMNDAFQERGNGLGTTFSFDSFPLRIDFIFTSSKFDVLSFKTLKETFSDHHAIRATIGW